MSLALAHPKYTRRNYSASDKAVHHSSQGMKLASFFAEGALEVGDPRSIAKADILKESYKSNNVYHSEDQINRQTGELFDGFGLIADGLSSRLSKDYLLKSARRSRRKINATMDAQRLLVGLYWRFMTLTLPYLRADVVTVFKIKTYAETLFKKHPIWRANVQGAFIAEELKIGNETRPVNTHWHAHTHILMLGKEVKHYKWADIWTDCVEKACKKFGVEFLMTNLKSNRLMVDVRDVRKYAKKQSMTFADAVNELVKYCTKGSEFEKVPRWEIIEIEKALNRRQMIKSYGSFNNQQGSKKQDTVSSSPSLVVQSITDEKRILIEAEKRETLVDQGARLIAAGRRDEWLLLLAIEFEKRRDFKRDYLARKNPNATFWTLEGKRFFGVSKRPPPKSNVLQFRN